MKRMIILWVLLVSVLSSSQAQTKKVNVDIQKSSVEWTGKQLTGEHYGNVLLKSAELSFKDKKLIDGTFAVDMNSITCTDISDQKSNKRLVDHLKSEDFFSVSKFPVSRFVITKVDNQTANKFDITGDLTIRGITNAVSFPATLTLNGKTTTAAATIVFDRSKYDVKFGSQSFFENVGDKMVYDDIELKVQLVFER